MTQQSSSRLPAAGATGSARKRATSSHSAIARDSGRSSTRQGPGERRRGGKTDLTPRVSPAKGRAAKGERDAGAEAGDHRSGNTRVVRVRGMGLASKFTLPVCILIAVVMTAWGLLVSRTLQATMENDVNKTGVTGITLLEGLGRQILQAKEKHPGAWPLVVGVISTADLVKAFGEKLEVKVLELGFENASAAYAQLVKFQSGNTVNRRNRFTSEIDVARALDQTSVEEAKLALDRLRMPAFSAPEGNEVRGFAEMPLSYFDQADMAEKLNKLIDQSAILSAFLGVQAQFFTQPISNGVLDCYITEGPQKILARARGLQGEITLQMSSAPAKVDFGPGEVTLKDVTINEGTITTSDGQASRAKSFTKTIRLPSGSFGTAFLALSVASIEEERAKTEHRMLLVGVAAIIFAAGLCLFIARQVTRPVHTLIRDMEIVARGDLRHKTVAHSSDEIGAIALQFNQMTYQLLLARDAEKEKQRIEDELEMAREIQMTLLPSKIPHIKGLDIHATYHPAKEVGGDYYDFFGIDKEHLGIVVADVSGKGIPGSMVMGTTRTILRFTAAGNVSAADALARTNRVVAADIRRGMFVTAYYIVLHARTHEMLAASAGHNPMVVFRAATGEVELVNPNGIALGFDKGKLFDRTIKEQLVPLHSGDRVVLYTDGVVESMNQRSEEYTDERLYDFVKTNRGLNSQEFVQALLEDLRRHQGNAEQHDDITIVSVRVE